MSVVEGARGYALKDDEGEAIWFNGSLGLLKATAAQTGGSMAGLQLHARKDFSSPLHIHHAEDEMFVVLSGDVRVRHGDEVMRAKPGSLVYGPRHVPHAFRVDSDEARILLLFTPGGIEQFFKEAGKPAPRRELPPVTEMAVDKERLMAIGARFGQEYIGPPLPPLP